MISTEMDVVSEVLDILLESTEELNQYQVFRKLKPESQKFISGSRGKHDAYSALDKWIKDFGKKFGIRTRIQNNRVHLYYVDQR
jgi:hypothetical protein